jgi:hypothetical protein
MKRVKVQINLTVEDSDGNQESFIEENAASFTYLYTEDLSNLAYHALLKIIADPRLKVKSVGESNKQSSP